MRINAFQRADHRYSIRHRHIHIRDNELNLSHMFRILRNTVGPILGHEHSIPESLDKQG
jgi:hypothetical protein